MRDIFLYFWIVAPLILWFGMLYGDYLDGEYTPFWQKKKDGVNSGAKFG
tara:strand:- start:280 stop:426 length:147 start_codon:yes stop_codon:yes gene_type:complete